MRTIYDIADYYLAKEAMTPKKLQKILYYAYSWFLTLENEPDQGLTNKLFNEQFEAWVHGPVNYEIYKKYQDYGSDLIEKYTGKIKTFSQDVIDVLEEVWRTYGGNTAYQLEHFTHQEAPWLIARGDTPPMNRCRAVINDENIYNFYKNWIEHSG